MSSGSGRRWEQIALFALTSSPISLFSTRNPVADTDFNFDQAAKHFLQR